MSVVRLQEDFRITMPLLGDSVQAKGAATCAWQAAPRERWPLFATCCAAFRSKTAAANGVD
jgi:hypothetical protein